MTTENVTATDLEGRLAELVEEASRGHRLRVTRHGRVQVGIVSPEDRELL
jgi:prevent-host-death family protein